MFWNIASNQLAFPSVCRIAVQHSVDILLLAECPDNVESLVESLNVLSHSSYHLADNGLTKVRGISKLPKSDFFPHYTNLTKDLTFWNLLIGGFSSGVVQVGVMHLSAKCGGLTSEDQLAIAHEVAADIREYEKNQGCSNTMLIGDLNMNPFDPGVVSIAGLHGAMTCKMAARERVWRKETYTKFYNPMWSLFGDRTPGPPGTYFWNSSVPSNHHWHMLDQLLLRASLIEWFHDVVIMDSDGVVPLANSDGVPTKAYISDHLPILCRFKPRREAKC